MPDEGRPGEESGYDANDPVQAQERSKSARLRERQRREFVARMLADPAGRDWLWSVLDVTCRVWEPRFGTSPAGFEQRDATFFQLGQREVGLQLMRELMRDHPVLTATMISENG